MILHCTQLAHSMHVYVPTHEHVKQCIMLALSDKHSEEVVMKSTRYFLSTGLEISNYRKIATEESQVLQARLEIDNFYKKEMFK